MNASPVYPVRLRRDPEHERYWLAETAVGDDAVVTFGRTLTHAYDMARDAVAAWLDVEADRFGLDYRIELPGELHQTVLSLRATRAELARREQEAGRELKALAGRLVHDEGLSHRDAALVLGVSHQRISQILRDAAA